MPWPTKIEFLARRKSHIRQRVEWMFEKQKPLRAVRDMLARECGVNVSHEAVRHYRQKWEVEREKVRAAECRYRALVEILGEEPGGQQVVKRLLPLLAAERRVCG